MPTKIIRMRSKSLGLIVLGSSLQISETRHALTHSPVLSIMEYFRDGSRASYFLQFEDGTDTLEIKDVVWVLRSNS